LNEKYAVAAKEAKKTAVKRAKASGNPDGDEEEAELKKVKKTAGQPKK